MQYEKFGNYIKIKRKKLGISLDCFAFESGLDSGVLSSLEDGKSDEFFKNFLKIARGFKMSPSELLSEFEEIN